MAEIIALTSPHPRIFVLYGDLFAYGCLLFLALNFGGGERFVRRAIDATGVEDVGALVATVMKIL